MTGRGRTGWWAGLMAGLALSACATTRPVDGFFLATNEPFRAVEVLGDHADYQGVEVDLERRRYRVVAARDAGGGMREWRAEADGSVLLLTIAPGPCEDSMSGARYPFRASIAIDGSVAAGCARRLSDPQPVPPGEQG